MTKYRKPKLQKKTIKELKNQTVLITGGAGSIGSHLVMRVLGYPVKTIRVLDIDEHFLFRFWQKIFFHDNFF